MLLFEEYILASDDDLEIASDIVVGFDDDKNFVVELIKTNYMVSHGGERRVRAVVEKEGTLIIREKLLTEGNQYAATDFSVDLNGENSGANVISRSVAKGESKQVFRSNINGNAACSGHTECDAIIMDEAHVSAIPEINANHIDASLIHEAAIGKIAGEQLIKLMTLGLTEQEAEAEIVNGFLR